MATAIRTIARDVSLIVNDLATTRQRQTALYASTIGRDLSEQEDELWSKLDDRRDALEAEFDAAVFATTGVSWKLLEGARA